MREQKYEAKLKYIIMKDLKFKTTLSCGGCLTKVTPGMDAIQGIKEWKVDLESADKIMTVKTSEEVIKEIQSVFEEKGFEVELL